MSLLRFRKYRIDQLVGRLYSPSQSTVTVYRAGAVVNGNQSLVSAVTVRRGHRFPTAGGVSFCIMRYSGGEWAMVASSLRAVTSVSGTDLVTVNFSGGTLTFLDGDYLVNLGNDAGSSGTPLFTASPVDIFSDPEGKTTRIASSSVTPNTRGDGFYWTREDRLWEVVRDGTTPLALIPDVEQTEEHQGPTKIHRYATGGSGTATDPWTGWEPAVLEGQHNDFVAGYFSAPTLPIQVTSSNAPSRLTITGAGPGITILTITSATGQLKIYGSDSALKVLNGVRLEGMTIRAGANNTSSGLVHVQQLDLGSYVGHIWVDPTVSFFVTVGINVLNCENCSFGPLECRGWSSTDAAAGNIRTGVKISTDTSETGSAIQRGNLYFSWVHVTNVTTGLSIFSTGGGSLDNIFFSLFKAVNSGSVVDGTTAISLAANSEQISFGDLHMEVFNNGLVATGVEMVCVHNGLASQCHNVANNAGAAFTITNGDGGVIRSRLSTCFNGVVFAGTTTRLQFFRGTASSISGTLFSDTSSGVNTELNGQTFTTPVTHSGRFTSTGGFSIGTAVSGGALASDTLTIPANMTSNVLVTDTEGGTAYDELSTISGGFDGQIIHLSNSNDARSVLVKHTTGGATNILLGGQGNRLLGNSIDVLTLRKIGSNWVETAYQSTRGDQNCNAEEITLSTGGLTTNSAANLLPANSVIEAVTAYVTTTITTTTNWALGVTGNTSRFSSPSTSLTAGSTVIGLNHRDTSAATPGPVQTLAATVQVTCTGSNPGAGKIRVFVFFKTYRAPAG